MTNVTKSSRTTENGFSKFEKVIRYVENILNNICMVMLLVMALLGAADVIGRYVFNHPIAGTLEISRLMMGGVIFLAWAYVLSEKGHVTVDILFNHFSPRLQAILNFIMLPLSFVIFAVIAWRNVLIALSNWHSGEKLLIIDIPVAPLKILVIVGAILFCLECIIQMVRLFPTILRKKEG
jgi:TRAP-type transport system small permease protein